MEEPSRHEFWSKDGTYAIVGSFETPQKLSSWLLKQCLAQGISAVPVNPELGEVQGVRAVASPDEVESLAGIICVRFDPHATEAVKAGARLGVPVWLSLRVNSDEAMAAAESTGADVVSGVCPLMYLNSGSFHACHRFVAKVFGKF